jgi:ribonucleoside-diphosphate reductase beta chain
MIDVDNFQEGDTIKKDNMSEQNEGRGYSIFEEQISQEPDHYPFCDFYIEAIQDSFWTHRLYTFQSDVQDFKVNLTEQERVAIIRMLSMISQLEVSVKKFWARIGDNLPHPAIYDLGYTMASNEVVHGKAYKNLLKVLGIKDTFEEILEIDIVKGRVNYLTKHLHKFHSNNKKQFIYSLILFTLFIENLALFAPFYSISWFNRVKNVLKDTNKQVQYTAREETLHANIGIHFIKQIKLEHPDLFDDELKDKVLHESEQSVKYECKIIEWMLNGVEGIGEDGEILSAEALQNMIRSRLNASLNEIGYYPIFEIDQELLDGTKWFQEQLLANNKSDFFQERPSEYGVASQSFSEDDLF